MQPGENRQEGAFHRQSVPKTPMYATTPGVHAMLPSYAARHASNHIRTLPWGFGRNRPYAARRVLPWPAYLRKAMRRLGVVVGRRTTQVLESRSEFWRFHAVEQGMQAAACRDGRHPGLKFETW